MPSLEPVWPDTRGRTSPPPPLTQQSRPAAQQSQSSGSTWPAHVAPRDGMSRLEPIWPDGTE
eukprot:2555536-Prymnesium_polylepis.1